MTMKSLLESRRRVLAAVKTSHERLLDRAERQAARIERLEKEVEEMEKKLQLEEGND